MKQDYHGPFNPEPDGEWLYWVNRRTGKTLKLLAEDVPDTVIQHKELGGKE